MSYNPNLASVAASKLVGRGSAGGTGSPQEITLGTNLTMSGTTLNASGGAGSGGSGVTTVDFGAFPGASDASVTISGEAGILAGSRVTAHLVAVATADHSADEHWVETIEVTAGNIVAGDGFTIYARNTSQLNEPVSEQWGDTRLAGPAGNIRSTPGGGAGTRIYGTWTVGWAWA